jgi:acetate kinase
MNILAINCGSSTLKFQAIALESGILLGKEECLACGIVDGIGAPGELKFVAGNGERLQVSVPVADHGVATRLAFQWLESCSLLKDLSAVGHRVVHGGNRFWGSA